MKITKKNPNNKKAPKTSLLTYITSISIIGVVTFATSSIMGCSIFPFVK